MIPAFFIKGKICPWDWEQVLKQCKQMDNMYQHTERSEKKMESETKLGLKTKISLDWDFCLVI